MESIIANLVSPIREGLAQPRTWSAGLALLAPVATGAAAAAAPDEIDFKTATSPCQHSKSPICSARRLLSKDVRLLRRREDKPLGIVRLGNMRTLVS